MSGSAVPPVSPGSTPLRELALAVANALALPAPATTRDELPPATTGVAAAYWRSADGRSRRYVVRRSSTELLARLRQIGQPAASASSHHR